jgi:hypothetical protein
MRLAELNSRIADLNESISCANDCFEGATLNFEKKLQSDFAFMHDAIFKYFVYQTSFIKNTEYDANNILVALEQKKNRDTVASGKPVRRKKVRI